MDQLQRDILYFLKESRKPRGMSISEIATRVHRNSDKVTVELGILLKNNLIECDYGTSKRYIKRARISKQGVAYFTENTKIDTKESVIEQISALKERIESIEKALEEVQQNPTEENKKSLLEKADTLQSVANGIVPLIKAGIDLFK